MKFFRKTTGQGFSGLGVFGCWGSGIDSHGFRVFELVYVVFRFSGCRIGYHGFRVVAVSDWLPRPLGLRVFWDSLVFGLALSGFRIGSYRFRVFGLAPKGFGFSELLMQLLGFGVFWFAEVVTDVLVNAKQRS